MSPNFPGNVNDISHAELHPKGEDYAHQEYPRAVYRKAAGKDEGYETKSVADEKELKAALADGWTLKAEAATRAAADDEKSE